MSGNHHARRWHGILRDEILWQPLIQSCLCNGCGLCVTSCPAEALAFDFRLQVPFVDSCRCQPGCSTCATLCPHEAILLPERQAIQEVIASHHLDIVARRELRRRRKRFAGTLPEAHYRDDMSQGHN